MNPGPWPDGQHRQPTQTLPNCLQDAGTSPAEFILVASRFFLIRIVLGSLWLIAVGAGFVAILNYQSAEGPAGAKTKHWPSGTRMALDRDRCTLVLFAHPKCPCTRASLEELNRLLAQSQGRVTARVLFYRPAKFARDWSQTGLWRSAASIPGVEVEEDPDGAEARLFGAETSGYVLLYDSRGQLLFNGGITGGRGHAGDNAGESAIVSLLMGPGVIAKQAPVYGCSLSTECEALAERAGK